jgi:hypothetical protein
MPDYGTKCGLIMESDPQAHTSLRGGNRSRPGSFHVWLVRGRRAGRAVNRETQKGPPAFASGPSIEAQTRADILSRRGEGAL